MGRVRLLVTLELDPWAEPIRGTLTEEGGEERSFDGWLGLTATLQAAISRALAEETQPVEGSDEG